MLPTKSPLSPKPPQLLQYICCAVFQSNSLSKSARMSGIKISKVKIWGELFKRTLFCAPALGTFVSKYFWTGKIVGRGLSFMSFNWPVRHSACVPSTYKPLLSNRFILFIVSHFLFSFLIFSYPHPLLPCSSKCATFGHLLLKRFFEKTLPKMLAWIQHIRIKLSRLI